MTESQQNCCSRSRSASNELQKYSQNNLQRKPTSGWRLPASCSMAQIHCYGSPEHGDNREHVHHGGARQPSASSGHQAAFCKDRHNARRSGGSLWHYCSRRTYRHCALSSCLAKGLLKLRRSQELLCLLRLRFLIPAAVRASGLLSFKTTSLQAPPKKPAKNGRSNIYFTQTGDL